MMSTSDLTTCRNLLDMLQDCNGEVADYWGRMLEHIDELTGRIATLKAALIDHRTRELRIAKGGACGQWKKLAIAKLAQEYPEIFKEE